MRALLRPPRLGGMVDQRGEIDVGGQDTIAERQRHVRQVTADAAGAAGDQKTVRGRCAHGGSGAGEAGDVDSGASAGATGSAAAPEISSSIGAGRPRA